MIHIRLVKPFIYFFVLLLLLTIVTTTRAQPNQTLNANQLETISTLRSLLLSSVQVEQQIRDLRDQLQTVESQARREELLKELDALLTEKVTLERNFEQIATGVDIKAFDAAPQFEFDWSNELKELLSPIIGELKELTNRPRELEKLRRETAVYSNRIPTIEKALKRLENTRTNVLELGNLQENKDVIDHLQSLEKSWHEELRQAKSNLVATEHRLADKLDERKSLLTSAHRLFAGFFRSRGRNLAVAVLSFFIVLVGMRYFHRIIDRISPWHREKRRSFYVRLADVVYYSLTFIFSILAFVTVLYLYGDWVLLGLAMIFLVGLAWAARKGLPFFWQQGQTLLNLGTVREGESVIIDGLPWKVETINVYTYLLNPALKGGHKRVPLRDLLDMRSRERADGEPWFPCMENDWVILGDGTRGKVVAQTPEMVELVKLGGSHKTYTTIGFLDQTPMNISRGFRLHVTFGVDYAHQSVVTTRIPEMMRQVILKGIAEAGFEHYLVNLKVEFESAGASSLDLMVLADFSGDAAPKYDILERLINRLAVDACNEHKWTIPFTQLTLHQAQ